MKKILLPLEGSHYPQEMMDFVDMLHAISPLMLAATFVPESDYASLLGVSGLAGSLGVPSYEREAEVVIEQSEKLRQFCREKKIPLKVHLHQDDFALPSIREESRYADLMLLSGIHFFEELQKEQPNVWMKETLHHAECPVLLLPESGCIPGEVILAYDGSADAVYAIRQFAYLFPEFMDVPATLVYISEKPDAGIPEEWRIRELCAQHFADFRLLTVNMRTKDFPSSEICSAGNAWLIAGSYGRTALSETFSGSFCAELIRRHRIPVFVAHRP